MHKKELISILVIVFILTSISLASASYNNYNYYPPYTVYHQPSTDSYYKKSDNIEESVSTSYDYYGTQKKVITRKEKSTLETKDTSVTYTPLSYSITYTEKSYGDRYYTDVYHHPDYYVYPSTDWRYKPKYQYSDYGNDNYRTTYYYSPRYDYNMGSYNWRY